MKANKTTAAAPTAVNTPKKAAPMTVQQTSQTKWRIPEMTAKMLTSAMEIMITHFRISISQSSSTTSQKMVRMDASMPITPAVIPNPVAPQVKPDPQKGLLWPASPSRMTEQTKVAIAAMKLVEVVRGTNRGHLG